MNHRKQIQQLKDKNAELRQQLVRVFKKATSASERPQGNFSVIMRPLCYCRRRHAKKTAAVQNAYGWRIKSEPSS